jgi:hypothetical protein
METERHGFLIAIFGSDKVLYTGKVLLHVRAAQDAHVGSRGD